MTKQAIPYIRYSSYRQHLSESYERQKEAVQRWLANHPEYTLSSLVFEDLGKSGFSTKASKKASGMVKITEAINAGLIQAGDAVLVEAFDRATRQQALDALELITPILRAGVSIITLDDGIEYTRESLNGSHAYLLVAKIQQAHNYSKILSERIKSTYKTRKQNAEQGKAVKRHTPMWLNVDGSIRPAIAPRIADIFDLYIAGVGKHSIAAKLRLSGIKELSTCSAPTIDGWLRNKTVIGYWGDIPNVYPAIVEPEKFYLVQKLLKERATIRKRTPKNFLVGLVRCAECNGIMIIHNVKSKPNAFRCMNHHKFKDAGCSNNKSIPYNVIQYLYLRTAWYGLERALQKQTLTNAEKQKILIQQEIDTISQNITKLVALVLNGDIPEISQKLSELNQKRTELQAELDSIEAGAVTDTQRQAVILEEKRLISSDPLVLNAMLRDAGYWIAADKEGNMSFSELGDVPEDKAKQIITRYAGVQRKEKSNQTEYYKLISTHTGVGRSWIYKINPTPGLDLSTFPLEQMNQTFDKPIQGRLGNILIGVDEIN
ncbi:recombinase family protein [Zestomonas thermotolerans]|uniref:recombinase family protein n=1 Tax=Zestomonas thermotolerans TaxID=157784 RepID=UPI0004B8675C|nr:recombinase family protein [Pseudomonas thermotolerans]